MTQQTLERQIQRLTDLSEINDLITRFGRGLDLRDVEILETVFVSERFSRIAAACEANARFWQFSQHVITDRLVELQQDVAIVHANLIGSNVARREGEWSGDEFDVAGRAAYEVRARYEFRVVRTAEGWRIEDPNLTYLWSIGEAPKY